MKRNKMLIISITSIIIIALALIGITFGYYLTKITGNENNKSVTVESANKEVEIKEIKTVETGVISEGTTKIIEPGYENIKIFTVQNIGNAEATYHIYLDNVVNTFNRTQDITYTLYRKSGNNTIDTDNLSDSDIVTTGVFPKNNSYIQVNETITNPNDYYTYVLKVTYINSETEDQSEDQGKNFSYKIQLQAEIETPYSDNKQSLAYNIINNAITVTNEQKELGYAEYRETPLTTPAVEISGEDESTLSTTQDDYGTSYYYRGNVENNYLTFNNMCWRIVRIEGDGSTKIVLADKEAACSTATQSKTDSAFIGTGDYGYDSSDMADYENSQNRTSSMKYKFNIFLNGGSFESYDSSYNTITKTYTAWSEEAKSKLKKTTACIGDVTTKYDENGIITTSTSEYYYDAYRRLKGLGTKANATLLCGANGTKTSETQIFPLTADEVAFAGGIYAKQNYTYYLNNNVSSNGWWSLSLIHFSGYDTAFYVSSYLSEIGTSMPISLRPAVSLVSGTIITGGDGTISNPYIVG